MADRLAAALADVEGLPPYRAELVHRIASCVAISSLSLIETYFGTPHPEGLPPDTLTHSGSIPQFGLDASWTKEDDRLGCIVTFATLNDESNGPMYSMMAKFRVIYRIVSPLDPSDDELEQFAHWRALFDVWPYWREFHSTTVTRSGEVAPVAPLLPSPGP